MVMRSSICHCLSRHGHALIIPAAASWHGGSNYAAIIEALCAARPLQRAPAKVENLRSISGEKKCELGRRWAGFGSWPQHRPPPHLHSSWPDLLLAAMLHSHWLGSRPAAFWLVEPVWSARCCARRRLIHRNTHQSSAAPHHCDTELLRARKIPVLCFSLQKRTTKIGHKNGLWRGPGVIISENNSE